MGVFRLLLAACVLFGHSKPLGGLNWLPATTAVESFFVISGFYMQLILREKYTLQKLGNCWRLNFYLARYARLFPAYFVWLAITCAAGFLFLFIAGKGAPPISIWSEFAGLEPTFRNVMLWIWTFLANISIFFQDLGGVLAIRDGQVALTWNRHDSEIYVWSANAIPQAWSLGVELLFYILAPFLLNGSDRRLLFVFALGFVVKAVAIHVLGGDLPYRMFPFVLVEFLGGALAYRNRTVLARIFGKHTTLIAYLFMLAFVTGLPPYLTDAQFSWISLVLTMFIVPALFEATKRNPTDAMIGELSYPFYVFHLLCFMALSFLFSRLGMGNDTALVSITLATTLVMSYIAVKLEFRFLEPWRQRLGREPAKVVLKFGAVVSR